MDGDQRHEAKHRRSGGGPGPSGGLGVERIRRVAPLAGLTARAAAEAARGALHDRRAIPDDIELHARTAERYAELLGRSKGALMKAGQMFSYAAVRFAVAPDLQAVYQSAFERLCADAPPMASELALDLLERELGSRAFAAFAEMDGEPIAAASIGQVHAARLRDGREVAVKIQYPGVERAISADLQNAQLLASAVTLLIGGLFPRRRRLDLRGVAREVGARITEELDYRLEARNQTDFAEHYRGHPFIHVPCVIQELSTERVLTQELVRGRPWGEALGAPQHLRDQWAEAIHRFLYGSLHRLHRLNADPHPGNFFFHDDGRVSFLDFGCVLRLREEDVALLESIYRACLRNDVQGTWRASVEGGLWRATDPVTPEEVFSYWRGDNALFWASERFVANPEYVARGIERRFSPTGPSANALRHCTFPPRLAMMIRVEIALMSIIGWLRAGADWGSFAAEYCEDAAPVTPLGRSEQEFFAQRGEA